jgi:hypothetical protein
MANANGWGDGSVNNNIGWGQGAVNNNISWGKSQITSWSGATDIDGGNAPVNTVAPAITGTAQEGQTLTCSTGTWSGSPTYTYQWKRNGSNIGSATNSTYLLVTADVGQSILCTVTATNALGSSNANSNTVTPTSSVDADAQAFITAAAITDPTQQSAINTLVVDLKGYNVWSKMKALYPFVGGTNSQHAWNLKDTTTYKITWYGGVTSSTNGILGNGTNGYGDTFLANNVMAQNDAHISLYSRTDTNAAAYDMGSWNGSIFGSFIRARTSGSFQHTINSGTFSANANSDGRGFYLVSRKNNTSITGYKNNTPYLNLFVASTSNIATSFKILRIGEYNAEYSPRNLAFASIGDGLTDAEALNFYTAVQAFQTTLGRSIGTQTVSDADAQAFVTAADIQDQVEANAINNLVIGMKADGLWTKMKALYPFVGGTASAHKFNLKDPRDLDAAFRLTFSGGWTHSSTGALPNGTNGYADTFLNASLHTSQNSVHLSYYSRTSTGSGQTEMGHFTAGAGLFLIYNFDAYKALNSLSTQTGLSFTPTNGMLIGSRIDSTTEKYYHKGVLSNTVSKASTIPQNSKVFIGANNVSGSASQFSSKQTAFASIGDGLTDTEAANFYTAVQAFQTALNRNI